MPYTPKKPGGNSSKRGQSHAPWRRDTRNAAGRDGSDDRSYNDRPQRSYSDRPQSDRPQRSYNDRPQGDRPQRSYSDRPQNDRPQRSYSDRPQNDRPQRSYNDRPQGDRPQRSYGDRPQSDRPQRSYSGDRPQGDRPQRSYSDRPQRSHEDRTQRSYSDRPQSDRPQRFYSADRPRTNDAPRPVRDNTQQRERFAPRNDYQNSVAPRRVVPQRVVPQPVAPALAEPIVERDEGREDLLFGRNTIREAIKAGRSVEKLLVQKDLDGAGRAIISLAREHNIQIQEVERARLDQMCNGPHQGIAAIVAVKDYVQLEDILEIAKTKNQPPLVVVLDGIVDPHNLGSILRSAECAGAHGVVVSKRRAAGLTSAVSRASAGAVEHIAVARVSNISQALETLKNHGLWVAGAHLEGQNYTDAPLEGPLALVLGGEGEGLGRLIRERCDFLVTLPLKGHIESLNASVAAGVLLYEVLRRR